MGGVRHGNRSGINRTQPPPNRQEGPAPRMNQHHARHGALTPYHGCRVDTRHRSCDHWDRG
ncbi:Hypothetical protein RY69_1462 [Bifidobacterium breve]|nr:Hypothetical protein RY69_1462 [Bifidobacterium breve]